MAKGVNVVPVKGGNTAHNSGGMPGYSCPQQPIPGPESPGLPPSMRKALTKKSPGGAGVGLPNRGTSYAGEL